MASLKTTETPHTAARIALHTIGRSRMGALSMYSYGTGAEDEASIKLVRLSLLSVVRATVTPTSVELHGSSRLDTGGTFSRPDAFFIEGKDVSHFFCELRGQMPLHNERSSHKTRQVRDSVNGFGDRVAEGHGALSVIRL